MKLQTRFLRKLKEVTDMLAMLYASRIIKGKYHYKDVPDKLKEQVADILRDADMANLIEEV